jgi:phosphatidylserine decarboxylase
MTRVFIILQYLLPHHLLSRLVGVLARMHTGRTILIRAFIKRYKVDMSEAVIKKADDFAHFNAFFTRELQPGSRPLATESGAIVCPADGSISQLGGIDADRIFQAKGHDYTVAELLACDAAIAQQFQDGVFATVYLSPRDYHRVHMPLTGKLQSMTYVPGKLFSVNKLTAENVPRVFARNERVVCLFTTAAGPMAVVLVGAMIVAAIETSWSGQVCPGALQSQGFTEDYSNRAPAITLPTGAELGRFKLGSTAIVLFGPGSVTLASDLVADTPVRMGQLLGKHVI